MSSDAVRYSRIAHELRGPIGVAQGAAAELERLAGAETPYAPMLKRSLERLLNVAQRLSHASAFLQGTAEHRPQPTDLGALVQKHAHAAAVLEQRVAKLAIEPMPSTIEARVDREWLGFCVEEIVRNALQHAHTKVRVALQSDADWATITIEDDGPGFSQPPRFSFEIDPEGRRGLGLSLAIANRVICDAHHGELSATEAQPKGAHMRIRLPMRERP